MRSYTIIASDQALANLLASWKEAGIDTVSIDFEGEFNLHIYGEHLCLVQLFDKSSYYLIDPFKVTPTSLASLLEDKSLTKLMFDCASDSALVRKEFGIKMGGIYDVRVLALALGFTGNLTGLVDRCLSGREGYVPSATLSNKKKNQMTNWLNRPLREEQIQYALSDVEHLFAIKEILEAEIAQAGLEKEVAATMKGVALPKGPAKPGWVKVCNWKYLSKPEQVHLKHFFIARDTLARKRNVPAVKILDKHLLVEMAKNIPQDEAAFRKVASHRDSRIEDQLVQLLLAAKTDAQQELRNLN